MSREHWEHESSNWATWARRPDFDAYWKYSAKFFELLPPPGGRTLVVGFGGCRGLRELAPRCQRLGARARGRTLVRPAPDAPQRGLVNRAHRPTLAVRGERSCCAVC